MEILSGGGVEKKNRNTTTANLSVTKYSNRNYNNNSKNKCIICIKNKDV